MLPDSEKAIHWLKKNPNIINQNNINRGIERETMRIDINGYISKKKHPYFLGSSLTHKWITTDFAESLLEFVTPIISNINNLLIFLRDIHRYTARNIDKDLMWPFSMPCYIKSKLDIKIAQYGHSNVGRVKSIYRTGLKNRYGSFMQSIAGIHYNFSLPMLFWKKWIGKNKEVKECISESYLNLIRNYYRFGWIITYLFGSSPAICSSFIQEKLYLKKLLFLESKNNTLYMPYATSLRLSNFGYSNKFKKINFNNLNDYISIIKKAINTKSKKYNKIGIKNNKGEYLQLNKNILQLENELYIPIRPKRKIIIGETNIDALYKRGIEYVEVRSLDINPFSPIGVEKIQILFMDIFLIWCLISEAPLINNNELFYINQNWNKIILEGRKKEKTIFLGYKKKNFTTVVKKIFYYLIDIAKILDAPFNNNYQIACSYLLKLVNNPELTNSAKILKKTLHYGINELGLLMAVKNKDLLKKESLEIIKEKTFYKEMLRSHKMQKKIELQDENNLNIF